MAWCYVFALTGLFLAVLHYYLTCTYRYWKERSIPYMKGAVPGLGNMYPVFFMKQNFSQMYEDIYNRIPDCSMVGIYDMREPSLMVRDPELVKAVMVKDFNSFVHNSSSLNKDLDPLVALNPFFLDGASWKASRTTLSTAFTSGKLKYMYVSIERVCAKLTKYLDRKIENNHGVVELELKELFSKYTSEVVADVVFGVEGDSFKSDKPGPFQEVGKIVFDPSLVKGLKQMLMFCVPFLGKILSVRFLPLEVDRFFRKLVKDALRMREAQGIERNDFLQLMMRLRDANVDDKIDGMKFDDDSITAHASSFFFDGYETSSITLCFAVYQLATHPDVQQRLRQEVESVVEEHDGLTYEAIQKLTYLDQVLDESLRIQPPAGALKKRCTKETVLEGSDGLRYRIKPGEEVIIPVQGLQMDPKYWPDPEKFDPDRFSVESKQERYKFAFLPFGEGPRICVGKRMALLQVKAAIASVVRKYSLELSPKTKVPLQMDPHYFMASAKGGLWVYLKPL